MQTTAPTIYNYNPATGELLGTSQADPDPLDADNWLIPAWATTTEPPEAVAGSVRCWRDGAWHQCEDNRGTLYQITNGEPIQHAQLGPLPVGFTREPVPGQHYTWNGKEWVFDEQAARAAYASAALLERNRLQVEATARIAPLQDAADLEDATEAERAELEAWKRYRVALNRVPLQDAYPNPIEWPTAPN
ncbi:tail fiber assembly protein [Pseudomonas sp. G34]|uniref:tail fiber assembly protein n=1 Tax=Pseudomonas sp. G34 TaxID=3059083 RepID=UPI002808A75D|nr:tail fiber assembly protein [Pseudomonas sp. G34]MDQ7987293.1 tail fiber assembly protein [Pseudomonas sp. G34]